MKMHIDDELKFHSLTLSTNLITQERANVWDYDLEYVATKDVSRLHSINLCRNLSKQGATISVGKGSPTLPNVISQIQNQSSSVLRLFYSDKNKIGNKGSKYLSRMNCPLLENINLCENGISAEGTWHLSKAKWSLLSVLWLNGNKLGPGGVQNLNKSDWGELRSLNLYKTSDDISQFRSIVLSISPIEMLDLGTFRFRKKETGSQLYIMEDFSVNQRRNSHLYPFQIDFGFLKGSITFKFQLDIIIQKIGMQRNQQSPQRRFQKPTSKSNTNTSKNKFVQKLIDTRKQVNDVMEYPRNIVGHVTVGLYRKYDDKKQIIGSNHGTGILIAPYLVLTCAHNLFSRYQQDYIVCSDSMKFSLAYHQYSGDQYNVKKVKYPQEYKEKKENEQNEKYDFSLLFLQQPKCNKKVDRIDFIWEETSAIYYFSTQAKASTYGYPIDLNIKILQSLKRTITNKILVGYQYENEGVLLEKKKENSPYFEYNMYAKEGQSGSPIFVYGGNSLKLIGIHKGEQLQNDNCFGVSLWSMKQFIRKWLIEEERADLIQQLRL